MDSAIDLDSKGFDSIDSVNQSTGAGVIDATVSTDEAAPHVHLTNGQDTMNQNGGGPWDNTVYGGDPYSSSTPDEPSLNGGGPS